MHGAFTRKLGMNVHGVFHVVNVHEGLFITPSDGRVVRIDAVLGVGDI